MKRVGPKVQQSKSLHLCPNQEVSDRVDAPQEAQASLAGDSVQTRQANPRRSQTKGLTLIVDLLKHKRMRHRLSLATVARRAGVPVNVIEKMEAYDLRTVGLSDLLAIATALGRKLTVELAPIKPKLPTTNTETLRQFDLLMRSRHRHAFTRNEPDREFPELLWDIVGDKERNWLYVVVRHRKKKNLRFAKVTNEPGGWSIAGQKWGIDAETDSIAKEMSNLLFKERQEDMLGPATS